MNLTTCPTEEVWRLRPWIHFRRLCFYLMLPEMELYFSGLYILYRYWINIFLFHLLKKNIFNFINSFFHFFFLNIFSTRCSVWKNSFRLLWCRKKTWIFSTNLQSIFPDSSVIRSFSVYFLCFTHSLPVRGRGAWGRSFKNIEEKLVTGTFPAYYRKFLEGSFPDT